jgi:hypothetical protein
MNWKIWVALVVGLFIGPSLFWNYGTHTTYEQVMIKSKEVKDGKYMVFTESGVFRVKDTPWYLQWDSSDIYNKITPETKQTISTYGWRVGFFSMYPGITNVVN